MPVVGIVMESFGVVVSHVVMKGSGSWGVDSFIYKFEIGPRPVIKTSRSPSFSISTKFTEEYMVLTKGKPVTSVKKP